ncbi:hypothetical protein VH98_10505 [Acinetobacter brisouii]|nr:hypothetical protein VH98_10505 [Acinetobacter brisouii]
MDASKAFKKSRTTIYEAIKNGELSRDNDGLIDLSELIRVYGNPTGVHSSTRTEHVQKDVQVHVQSEVEIVLKEQISLLKNQLDLANQREKSLMQHIEDLTHRIEFKGSLEATKGDEAPPNSGIVKEPHSKKVEPRTEQLSEKPKRYPIPEQVESEPEQRGFWSRFFKPYG